MFSTRYQKIAQDSAENVSGLWIANRLSEKNVRKVIRSVMKPKNIRYSLFSGSYRTALVLPSLVIKVPHTEDAIKSTVVEAKMFEIVRKNRLIAKHFPRTQIIHAYGMPVVLQERILNVATESVDENHPLADDIDNAEYHPAHRAVEKFAKKLGLGDAHLGNYGWAMNSKGLYPVFFDCEVSTGMSDMTQKQVEKLVNRDIRWEYPV
jgi:hypothetical protein